MKKKQIRVLLGFLVITLVLLTACGKKNTAAGTYSHTDDYTGDRDSLTLTEDGKFELKLGTDKRNVTGTYKIDGSTIKFTDEMKDMNGSGTIGESSIQIHDDYPSEGKFTKDGK